MYVCMHQYMYVCMYVFMYACMYVGMYVYVCNTLCSLHSCIHFLCRYIHTCRPICMCV